MTLSERLRYRGTKTWELACEAADALDARDARIKELEGALRKLTMAATPSGYGYAVPAREVVDEARALLDEWAERAREALK